MVRLAGGRAGLSVETVRVGPQILVWGKTGAAPVMMLVHRVFLVVLLVVVKKLVAEKVVVVAVAGGVVGVAVAEVEVAEQKKAGMVTVVAEKSVVELIELAAGRLNVVSAAAVAAAKLVV